MKVVLPLVEIRNWLKAHQRRLNNGDLIPSISSIAKKAGISRQTLYALLRDERTEFGQVAQIRLSRVIQEITSQPDYQVSKMMRLDLSGVAPRIRFGL
jgi:hypothetical protein